MLTPAFVLESGREDGGNDMISEFCEMSHVGKCEREKVVDDSDLYFLCEKSETRRGWMIRYDQRMVPFITAPLSLT